MGREERETGEYPMTRDRLIIILGVLFWISFIFMVVFGGAAVYYKFYSEWAIQEGAKNTVTALEMVVVCQQLSNVTSEQIKEQYIKTFILNQSREDK